MTRFYTFLRFSVILACLFAFSTALRAQSYTYEPDTLTINPNGADSGIGYVRIAYAHDTTRPGTYIHCWISDGSTYFSCPTDTVHDTTYIYVRVVYHTASDTVRGQLSISDDTTTKTVVLIGVPNPPPLAFTLEGPYFPSVPEGTDTCVTMSITNHSSTPDTLRGMSWTHNSNGIFTWDSTSLPYILGPGDTTRWTFCFHAPDNTNIYFDTIRVYYGSGDAYLSRTTYGVATSSLSVEGPYFPQDIQYGGDTCTTMTIVNNSYSADTIESVSWAHSSSVFSWDTTSLPIVLGAHDTTHLTFCFHAPDNSETNVDTIELSYHTSTGNGNASRIVEAAAEAAPADLSALGPYFPEHVAEGTDTCVTMRLVNTSSGTDTIESVNWSHNPNGIFVWDTTSVPFTLGAHDTTYLTVCWHAPDNAETNTDTIEIAYRDPSGSNTLTRLVSATAVAPPPDAELELYSGPYFPQVVDEGHDTCATMKLINAGTDVDTIVSVSWSHNPNGIFTWDSVSLPLAIGSNDTDVWTFCFHAPDDTNTYIDTVTVRYRDAYDDGDGRVSTRIIEGHATDPSLVTCYTLYASAFPLTNIGDTSRVQMYIRNDLPTSATLTGVHISGTDDGSFRVDSSSFPTTIASESYDSVELLFVPNRTSSTDNDSYSATLTAFFTTSDTAHCREASVALSGSMPQSCYDTSSVRFDTSGTDDVTIYGDSNHYQSHRINLVNTSGSTLIINSIGWTDSNSHFLVVQRIPSNLPDTLGAGDTLGLVIHYYADTDVDLNDTLVVSIDHDGTLQRHSGPLGATSSLFLIAIKGTQAAAPASVTPVPAMPALNLELYPNPASGMVTMQLDGVQEASFQIIDVLGNVIATHTGSAYWQFDPSTMSLIDGTYFIRAMNGNSGTMKRLVIQK